MQINYTEDAFISLLQLVNYIESTNTQGSGSGWLNSYEKYVKKKLQAPERIRFYNNSAFYQLQLRCIYFNDWIIAFSVNSNVVLIEVLLHKSRISD